MASVSDLIVATGEVKDGRLFLRNRRQFDEQIRQMRDGWQLEVTVQRMRATRSPAANAYYWSTVLAYISEYTGDTEVDLHDFFKMRFLPKRLAINAHGEETAIPGSTRKLNKVQFYDYIEQVRQFALSEIGVVIPDPDPLWREHQDEEATV
jgi:hypothetical protein